MTREALRHVLSVKDFIVESLETFGRGWGKNKNRVLLIPLEETLLTGFVNAGEPPVAAPVFAAAVHAHNPLVTPPDERDEARDVVLNVPLCSVRVVICESRILGIHLCLGSRVGHKTQTLVLTLKFILGQVSAEIEKVDFHLFALALRHGGEYVRVDILRSSCGLNHLLWCEGAVHFHTADDGSRVLTFSRRVRGHLVHSLLVQMEKIGREMSACLGHTVLLEKRYGALG